MRQVVIVSGARTAIGAFGGGLKTVSAIDLGATVMKETLKRAGVRPVRSKIMADNAPSALRDQGPIPLEQASGGYAADAPALVIDEVVMGNVLMAGQGQNPARQAMIRAGIPKETPAFTLNKVCGSGLKAITVGAQAIMTGQADVVLAGGQENMSLAPMALTKARWGHRMELTGVGEIHDLMVFDGLWEIFYGYHMGQTAENIASLYGIGRQEQDQLGVLSHNRARRAIVEGLFAEEIVPVMVASRKGDVVVDTDERPMETSMEKMARLKPAFRKDGTVTAGNASGINDAAAAVLLMTAEKARELDLAPILKIRAFASGGVDPAYMGLGPVPAVRRALANAGMTVDDIEMIELNEAFASQAIACMRELNIAVDRPNPLGSGISLGHPIGCTGARQMVTGMYEMRRRNLATGLFTMCIGGGMGMALIAER
jgi:acetyl-CoA C-acetyltransferase